MSQRIPSISSLTAICLQIYLALTTCNSSKFLLRNIPSTFVGLRGMGEQGQLLGNFGSVAGCFRKRGLKIIRKNGEGIFSY
jgi:hypothetical protein